MRRTQSGADEAARQAAIVERERSCLVIAGAGTGKTTLLVSRYVSLVGEGLSPSMLGRIFKDDQPFLSSGDGAPHKKGVGLGLAISRRIVEAHGGRICAEGKEGEGASFRFTLPLPLRDQDTREENVSA